MVLNLKLGDRVIGEIKKIVEITHPIVNPLPIHKDRELNLSKIDGNGGRSENLARKEGVKKKCGGGGEGAGLSRNEVLPDHIEVFLEIPHDAG